VLKDEKVPPRIRTLLSEIKTIKQWGESQGLKPTSNYTEYVQLNRNAAVWVVSACEELSIKSKEWEFPIVGSFPYLGWFDEKDALNYFQELKKEGWDVYLRPASAYSTLGWFRDPVLSSMISQGPEALGELVNVVIHESVHATVYIEGQAYFNESSASFIADQLTPEYLDQYHQKDSFEKKSYLESQMRWSEKEKVFHDTYQRLEELYKSSKTHDEKLLEKKKILDQIKIDLKLVREINNAALIQYKTYHTGYEVFKILFKKSNSNWPEFISSLKKFNKASFSKPHQDDLSELLKSVP
jgi:predicted aminopeptidase